LTRLPLAISHMSVLKPFQLQPYLCRCHGALVCITLRGKSEKCARVTQYQRRQLSGPR
jgi:hypothetical protein